MFGLFANPKKKKLTAKQKKALAAGRKIGKARGQAMLRHAADTYEEAGFQNVRLALKAAGKKKRSKAKSKRKATPAQLAALARGRAQGKSMMAEAVDLYHAGEYPTVQAALAVLGSEARANPRRRRAAPKARAAAKRTTSKRRK